MTDGNQGIQVAPITEEDMLKVRDILQRAADAIVSMSQLSADVNMLRQTVTSLQADTERLRSQNNALDEALNYSRKARDEQAAELTETQALLHSAEQAIDTLRLDNDKLLLSNDQLQIDLDLTRKAKDDAEFKTLELEDKLAVAEAKLAKMHDVFADMWPAEQPPTMPEVVPLPEPDPASIPDARPDSRDTWDRGYIWDHNTRKYWREGVTPKSDGADIPF